MPTPERPEYIVVFSAPEAYQLAQQELDRFKEATGIEVLHLLAGLCSVGLPDMGEVLAAPEYVALDCEDGEYDVEDE